MAGVMATPAEDFARRLHWALDQARFERGRGRASALAERYAVSRQTSRKWLSGLALPELARLMEIANDFQVSFDWLATGRGDSAAKRLQEPVAAPYGSPLSDGEIRVIQALRRLPGPKARVLLDLIEVLED